MQVSLSYQVSHHSVVSTVSNAQLLELACGAPLDSLALSHPFSSVFILAVLCQHFQILSAFIIFLVRCKNIKECLDQRMVSQLRERERESELHIHKGSTNIIAVVVRVF